MARVVTIPSPFPTPTQLEDALDSLSSRYEKAELELQKSQAREKALSEAVDTIARAVNPSSIRERERQKYEELRKQKSRDKHAHHHSISEGSSGLSSGADGSSSGLLGRPRAALMPFDQADAHHASTTANRTANRQPGTSAAVVHSQGAGAATMKLPPYGQASISLPPPPPPSSSSARFAL